MNFKKWLKKQGLPWSNRRGVLKNVLKENNLSEQIGVRPLEDTIYRYDLSVEHAGVKNKLVFLRVYYCSDDCYSIVPYYTNYKVYDVNNSDDSFLANYDELVEFMEHHNIPVTF